MDSEYKELEAGKERKVSAWLGSAEEEKHSEEELHALAEAYARYLAEKGLAPGDVTFAEPEELSVGEKAAAAESAEERVTEIEPEQATEDASEKAPEKAPEKNAASANKGSRLFGRTELSDEDLKKYAASLEKGAGKVTSVIDFTDRIKDRISESAAGAGRDLLRTGHLIVSSYRQSRKIIGTALLIIGVLAVVVLAVFDKYTVYEYAYNGKILGYVNNQEDVTDVLHIAGVKLTENSSSGIEVKFTPNQNVTFNLVDGRGKSTDDADITVNKLVYLTDIETEAYGIYDGNVLKSIVKSSEDADSLIDQTMSVLSDPDEGMKLVSAEFTDTIEVKPVNVLLTSVQSNNDALTMMTEGGNTQYFHIVEEGETLTSLAETFGVDTINIYDDTNSEVVSEVTQGDKVCIRKTTEPVGVRMVETGKMREVEPFETIKKKSDDYYEGDTHLEQEGIDGVYIFEGTLTKESGQITDRDEKSRKTVTKKQDKIIVVGTAERPKTAPTGTYVMPIHNYVLTSNFGYRWGRLHAGIDMAAPTGTPIYATDGGTVVKAEYYSGYGNVVFIEHENGRQTRYGHCSVLLVHEGDKVYQGQNIALVGNTGHSFGSHLHFEVLFNGTPTNPRPFLGI